MSYTVHILTPAQHAEHGPGSGQEARHADGRPEFDEFASRLQIEYWAAMTELVSGGASLAASLRRI